MGDHFTQASRKDTIGKEKIRTIDKTTFDAISRHSKEQGSKETDVEDFGLDIEQDLLRAVVGTPKSTAIGKRIYGMDWLTVTTNVQIEELGDYLERIHEKYLDESYKIDFPWVDQLGEVKDKSTIADLDQVLVSKIIAGQTDRIWMAVPEIIEWDQVGGFCYEMRTGAAEFTDIHLPDFLESLQSAKDEIRIDTFTKRQVHCIRPDGIKMRQWQAYKCLYAELTEGTKTYLLNGGKWYVVAGDFVTNVNEAYKEIPDYEAKLPDYNDASEGKYNQRVVAEMAGQFALMDSKDIRHGGGQSKIEFCDLYSTNCDIIHVKRYGGSSVFSHLFAQGKISGELFQMDEKFRDKVSEELPKGFKIADTKQRPKTDQYRIVYAIISDARGDLDIPFFSRLNMKNSTRSLVSMGYRVAKSKVDVNVIKAKLKKYRKRGKAK